MLEASLLALTYTNDMFTGYVFIETSTIAAVSYTHLDVYKRQLQACAPPSRP